MPPYPRGPKNSLTNQSWREDAECSRVAAEDPGAATFWVSEGDPYATMFAEKACEECPVRRQCLLDAMTDPSVIGVRAGVFFQHGGFVSVSDRRKLSVEFGVSIPRRRPPIIVD